MCPSDILEVRTGNGLGFGPGLKVFNSNRSYPCSIHVLNAAPNTNVQIQIKRGDTTWTDYEEGQLIISNEVQCRLSSNQEETLMIEVFHN
ncbi:MAG: hypothetical protein ACI9FU_000282 [Granulosicoccus sp.]|jgi:hypothetical protein